jgi:hypothetical protein
MLNHRHITTLLFILTLLSFTTPLAAQQINVGQLHVVEFQTPRQVSPNSIFSVKLDIEYAIHENATIRAAIFRGTDQIDPIWQSDALNVRGGGDQVWEINITAPPTDGTLQLSAYAYYRDGSQWKYLNETDHRSSYKQVSIRVSKNANLQIQLNVPNLQLTVGNLTEKTSEAGDLTITLPVGNTYPISVPSTVQLQNSTRLLFTSWDDGNNQTKRPMLLDGDVKLTGSYRTQYLLHLNSIATTYSYTKWYDANSKVTLESQNSIPMNWPFDQLGLKYDFQGWSGDVNSASSTINLTMNMPKTINANFSIDLTPLIPPTIIAAGIAGGLMLIALRRRATPRSRDQPLHQPAKPKPLCKNCGEDVQEDWTHCIRCGAKLTPETIK